MTGIMTVCIHKNANAQILTVLMHFKNAQKMFELALTILIQSVVMCIMIVLCNQTCTLVYGVGTPFPLSSQHAPAAPTTNPTPPLTNYYSW